MNGDTLSKTVRIDLTQEPDVPPGKQEDPPPPEVEPSGEPLPVNTDELFQSVYEAAFITNSAGTILKVNTRAIQLFGYESDILSGANVTEVIMGTDDTLLGQINTNLDSDRFTLIEATCVRNGGRDFHAEISVSRLTIEAEVHFVFFVRDITVRRRTEARLSQLNRMLRSLQRVSQVLGDEQDIETMLHEICKSLVESGRYRTAWICLTDREGVITSFAGEGHGAMQESLREQLTAGEVPHCVTQALGRSDLATSLPHKTGRTCAMQEGEGLCIRLASHGRIFGTLTVGIPAQLLSDEQELDVFRQLSSDISTALYSCALDQERWQAEQRLLQARDELEQRVQERTAQLANSNDDLLQEIKERKRAEEELRWAITSLKRHDEARTQFVCNVSHELRTPLTSINYFVDNMLRGITGDISAKAQQYLHMIHDDCRRLEGTVEDILDLSRLENNSLRLVRTRIPFMALARRTVESLRMQAETEHKRLSLQLDKAEIFVECDSKKIERVIINLVKNAIKFTGDDGAIRVVVKRERQGETDYACLEVTDNGIGIEREHIDKVTERYYRIGEHVSGTGLGLSISKDLVVLHDGTLTLESPPTGEARGTRVTVSLPSVPPATLLVVGQESQAGASLVATLTAAGYAASCTHDLHGITAAISATRPEVVLLEWLTEDVEPGAVIATLRTANDEEALPIVAITGTHPSSMKQDILNGFNIGTVLYPVADEALFDAIEAAMATRQTGMEPRGTEATTPATI